MRCEQECCHKLDACGKDLGKVERFYPYYGAL